VTPDEALKLATILANKIRDRRGDIATAVSYYKGSEGRMKFASDEFRDYFQRRFAGFSDNWCMPVAQAPVERIHYLGIRLPATITADAEIARRWERNDANRGLGEALLMMTIAKRSFGLVSPTSNGARITFENPDSAAVMYDAQTRRRSAGLTLWQDDRKEYASLLLPGSSLNLVREKVSLDKGERYAPPGLDNWQFREDRGVVESKHSFGTVPLVELRNQALLDNDPISDIAGVMAMQDAVNLVWAYLLNALDYASLPGRVVLNAEVPMEPILDSEGQVVGKRPIELDRLIKDRMMFIPGEKATLAEWTAANLEAYSKVIEHAVQHIAAQTRTPGHYLLSGSNVPATGYELSEAGLVSKAAERISYAEPEVREINRLAAIADGDHATAAKIEVGKVLWRKPQYRSEQQLMDGLQKMRAAGFPFQWIAEEYGLDPAEVDRVMGMVRREAQDPYLTAMKEPTGDADAEPPVSSV
jgi:hypothetical protein